MAAGELPTSTGALKKAVAEEETGGVLVILLELHPAVWTARVTADQEQGLILRQLLIFVNAYLLLSKDNAVVVYGISHGNVPLLYDGTKAGGDDEQRRAGTARDFTPPAAGILCGLREWAAERGEVGASGEADRQKPPSMSGALSRALCLIHRLRSQPRYQGAHTAQRMLVLQCSPEAPEQYIPVMNAIFSAQRADVIVDACVLGSVPCSHMQQATHITSGSFVQLEDLSTLLAHLLVRFAPGERLRESLRLPQDTGVDFQATCFLDKQPLAIGWVCSVCLSVFRTRLPSCTTCGTEFPLPQRPGAKAGPSRAPKPPPAVPPAVPGP